LEGVENGKRASERASKEIWNQTKRLYLMTAITNELTTTFKRDASGTTMELKTLEKKLEMERICDIGFAFHHHLVS
jgi:hypothetical protein